MAILLKFPIPKATTLSAAECEYTLAKAEYDSVRQLPCFSYDGEDLEHNRSLYRACLERLHRAQDLVFHARGEKYHG